MPKPASLKRTRLFRTGVAALFVEITAGAIAGCVATFRHSSEVHRTDEAVLSVAAFVIFGGALLVIPLGMLRGRRRRRRWLEAILLQGVLVFASVIALATGKHVSAAVWPFIVGVAVLALLLIVPAGDLEAVPPE
jgi:hypothetical protein